MIIVVVMMMTMVVVVVLVTICLNGSYLKKCFFFPQNKSFFYLLALWDLIINLSPFLIYSLSLPPPHFLFHLSSLLVPFLPPSHWLPTLVVVGFVLVFSRQSLAK